MYFSGYLTNDFLTELGVSQLSTQLIDKKSYSLLKKLNLPRTIMGVKDGFIASNNTSDINEYTLYRKNDYTENKIFFLEADNSGIHSIGGSCPNNFILPNASKSPFIYLGTIDGTDPYFNWIGIESLHICYPIFEGCYNQNGYGIYLDYANPNEPKILNPENISYSWIKDEVLPKNGRDIFYEKKYFKSVEKPSIKFECFDIDSGGNYMICGAPYWYQSEEIPVNKITNQPLRFVTTICSQGDLKSETPELTKRLPFASENLIFGDMGHIYVFFDPLTKILNVNMQF
jgi:hypothetical protein